MRKDIEAINEAYDQSSGREEDKAFLNPYQDRTEHAKEMEVIFYKFWEEISDKLSDEQLKATMFMIRHYDALNMVIKDEYRYRTSAR
jgi:hypothetical protein